MLKKIEGIIIRTQDYGETHKIITLYSREKGKLSGIAHGANKATSRMAAITQPFIHGSYLVYFRKGLSTIRQGNIINSFRKIREDIVKTAYVAFIAELTDKLLERQENNQILYEQFIKTIEWIEEKDQYEIPSMMYELKLYKYAGFSPVVDRCIICGSTEQLSSFSIRRGGVLCKGCFSKDENAIFLSEPLAKLLNIFLHVSIERIGNINVKQENQQLLRQLLDVYYEEYGSYPLKSRNFLKQIDLLE